MANDRLGNAIVAGQIFALAGTVRAIDGDSILIVVGERGEHAFRCKAGHIVKVDDTTSGGGAPTSAQYILAATNGSLPNGRALANSFSIEWELSVAGQVSANLGSGVLPAVIGACASYFSLLGHTHDAAEIVSGVLAVARLGTGTPSSSTYLRGDGVWSATSAFAAASHTHAASDITSGTIATARLGSGTASSTTFLRGDSAYSTIPTGAIDDNAITNAKLRDSSALSVIGRSANSSGDPADIATSADGDVLRRSGTTLGFGTIATAGIANDAVTDAKLRNSSSLSVIGRSANSSGDPADIAAGTDGHVLRRSGTTLGFGTIATAGITDAAVTDAKLRNSAALSLIGRSANSSGAPADIAAASDHQVMRRSGSAIAFGAVNLAQAAAVTGALPIANGGTGATDATAALVALGAAEAAHVQDGTTVTLDSSGWTGALASARPTNVQELADFLDANWPLP